MKVRNRKVEPIEAPAATEDCAVEMDLTRCTRCGQPWGYRLVERLEIWNCSACGYEARERSSDYWKILIAQQEAQIC